MAQAAPGAADALCDTAAALAARAEGVPLPVLLAITRVETGRGSPAAPWPWALNIGGEGRWLPSASDAEQVAREVLAAGRRDIDLGCFQLNHLWHGDGFASVEEMLEPTQNARYAAQFLRRLREETGSWDKAVAAYHSRDADRGRAYLGRVADELSRLGPGEGTTDPPQETGVPRANGYRLLTAGTGPSATGSLVPGLAPVRGFWP